MTATVEYKTAERTTLGEGDVLNHNTPGSERLSVRDGLFFALNTIMGLLKGYEISWSDGRVEVKAIVTKDSIVTIPTGYEKAIPLLPGNIYVLPSGTKIIPNE